MPGIQALVRFPLEQSRLDRAAGLRIATFISGYPGSPLAGYDLALSRVPDLLAAHDVTFVPAGNEELAATAHMGTQMLDGYPHANCDGVTSIWYGKGPGVDRSGDALKLVSSLCDSGESIDFTADDVQLRLPRLELGGVPFVKRTDFSFYPGANIEMEHHLYQERHQAVLAYCRINDINQIVRKDPEDTVGTSTSGKPN